MFYIFKFCNFPFSDKVQGSEAGLRGAGARVRQGELKEYQR